MLNRKGLELIRQVESIPVEYRYLEKDIRRPLLLGNFLQAIKLVLIRSLVRNC